MTRHGYLAVFLACLTTCLCAAPVLAADRPEIAVQASAKEIFSGESLEYLVEIRNVENPTHPDLTALRDDFDVKPNGDESRNQSSTTIINGRVTQESFFGHLYRFRLTPKRAGQLKIPAPAVTVNGKTITGRALPVNVLAPEEQDLVVPEISINRRRVYPTQPFELTLKILVHPLPDDARNNPLGPLQNQPPHVECNWVDPPAGLASDEKSRWLQPLLAENGIGFTLNDVNMRGGGFLEGPRAAVFNLYKGRERQQDLEGQTVNYFVYELSRRLTPEKSGHYTLGPATVKGTFVAGANNGKYSGRRLVAIAPAVEIEVRDVPEPRPATFCGGIGTYRVSAAASPVELRVGDPLTLTLDIERDAGSGSLDLISAPDLAANPQIADNFEIVDRNPTGRIDREMKRFTYALRPKRADVKFPAIKVTFFDPDTEEFSEIATRPVALTVSEASRLGAGELVGSLAGSGSTEIKSREQGIFQNVTDPTELRDQSINVVALAEVTVGTWGAVAGLIALVTWRRRKSGDVGWQRRQQARRAAEQELAAARTAGQSSAALRKIRAAVCGLIADMLNVVAQGLTSSDTDQLLSQTAVAPETRDEVRRVLEAIEAAEYGSTSESDVATLLKQTTKLIPELARQLERGA